jgi:hypothetical protein
MGVKPGDELHHTYRATCDLRDGAGHELVASYAVERPDGQWSLMLINRDQLNVHTLRVVFDDSNAGRQRYFTGPVAMVTFGSEQYVWHAGAQSGHPDPDGPPVTSTLSGGQRRPTRCRRPR